jgi:hypothetical protein
MDNSYWRYVSNHAQPARTSDVNAAAPSNDQSALSTPSLAH